MVGRITDRALLRVSINSTAAYGLIALADFATAHHRHGISIGLTATAFAVAALAIAGVLARSSSGARHKHRSGQAPPAQPRVANGLRQGPAAPIDRVSAAGVPVASAAPGLEDAGRWVKQGYIVAFCAYLSFAAVFQVFPPFFDQLERELHISRTVASLAMTSFLVPLVASAFLLGVAVDRHGHRRVGAIGCAILAAGAAATIAAGSFPALLATRALAGLGGGMVLIATLRMLATTLPAEQLGGGFGVFIAGLPAGTGLAFDVFNHLGGWRSSAAAAAALPALLTLGFVIAAPSPSPGQMRSAQRADRRVAPATAATLRHLALLVVVGYSAIIAFTTWAPSRLKSYAGLSPAITAAIASILLLIDLPFAPLWGRVSDILARRKVFVIASFLIYGTGAALVPLVAARGGGPVGVLIAVVATMGIGCAMFFPATLAIPPTLISGDQSDAHTGCSSPHRPPAWPPVRSLWARSSPPARKPGSSSSRRSPGSGSSLASDSVHGDLGRPHR